jgi:hypothetical protein
LQNVHLVITPWRSGSRAFFSDGVASMKYHSWSCTMCRARYGHAIAQYPQPMHMSYCTNTMPSLRCWLAPVGHTGTHGGSAQC